MNWQQLTWLNQVRFKIWLISILSPGGCLSSLITVVVATVAVLLGSMAWLKWSRLNERVDVLHTEVDELKSRVIDTDRRGTVALELVRGALGFRRNWMAQDRPVHKSMLYGKTWLDSWLRTSSGPECWPALGSVPHDNEFFNDFLG